MTEERSLSTLSAQTTLATYIPTGAAGAALLAGSIGALFLGLMTTASKVSPALANSLRWIGRAGPLSGMTTAAVIVWLLSWVGLNAALKNKEVDLGKVFIAALVLIGLGLLFTFPPVFELLAGG